MLTLTFSIITMIPVILGLIYKDYWIYRALMLGGLTAISITSAIQHILRKDKVYGVAFILSAVFCLIVIVNMIIVYAK